MGLVFTVREGFARREDQQCVCVCVMGDSIGVDDLGSRWSAVRNGTNSASIVLINILNLL